MTIADLGLAYRADTEYRDSVNLIDHTLVDTTSLKSLPPGILTGRRGAPAMEHPRSGVVVMVGVSNFVRSVVEAGFRVARFKKVKFVATQEEVWAYLRKFTAEEQM